ncbi:MAG: hypothetical protein IRZ16_01110 [Myxococcaceae bacterium]|nr:hypothetical protein [Myxococcaceae bacterium]
MIGLFSDSHGDLEAFDAAYELLRGKGARRFIFAGGRFNDLDEWVLMRKRRARGGRTYTDADFLADVTNFLCNQEQVARPPAFFDEAEDSGANGPTRPEDFDKVKERFVRVPDKDSLQYRDASIPNKAVDMLGDALCTIVHDKNDLEREDLLNALVFIHGREPEPKVVQIGPRYFITPGKLTGAAEQTCGLIELVDRNLRFSAFRLDGKVLVDRHPVELVRKNKLSVK